MSSMAPRSGSAWATWPTTSWSSRRSIEKRHKGITAFIVERGMDGFSTGTLKGKLGINAGNTGQLFFDDVRVPVANRVGEEGEGFTIAMSAIDQGRFTVATGAVGLAQACLDASVTYAHDRQHVRPGDRRAPARQADAGPHAPGHRGRTPPLLAGGLPQEPRSTQHARDEPRQVVLHRARGAERTRRHPGPRRLRLLE